MASSGLPSGAFLTTIQGRRCTAVPRIAAVASVDSDSATTATSTTTSAQTTTIPNPTTGLVAAPAAEIDTGSAGTTSPLVATTGVPPGQVRIAQAPDSESGPPPRRPARPPQPSPAPDATSQPIAALADVTSSGASVAESSQADASVIAPAADTLVNSSQETDSAETAAPDLPEGPAATPLLTTIEPPQTPTEAAVPDSTGTSSADAVLPPVPSSNNNAVQSTVAVAGGVIGGVVAISVLAFFIWWWRRRAVKKRRSTLLTPLDAVPSFDRDEKRGYVITRGSIGPTPVSEKVRAALGQNFKKIRGHIRNRTAPSVNLDRGTSQFIDGGSIHSRASSGNSGIIGVEPTAKDRFRGWLGAKFSRRNNRLPERSPPAIQERKPPLSGQPDFLTLLNMDDGELNRETQRRRASMARRNGSASSTDNFLGLSLNFDNDNPFTDANAIARTSAKPAPLAVNQTANPFSDTNAIRDPPPAMPKPTTYVADLRRSRSNSTSVAGGRQPSTAYHPNRDSIGSLRSMATATTTNQRNKFRSDPFDLERPELLGSSSNTKTTIRPPTTTLSNLPPRTSTSTTTTTTSSTAATAGSAPTPEPQQPQPPVRARTRAESFTSRYSKYSKYSSGISAVSAVSAVSGRRESMGDWSDPGPDVGPAATAAARDPAAAAWVVPDGNGQAVQGWRERLAREREEAGRRADGGGQGGGGGQGVGGTGRRTSGGSLGSVGKAM